MYLFQLIFFWSFSLIIIVLNIYCFSSRKYPYLFIPCMLFLPDYYAVEIGESFPILSIRRIMLVIFFIYTIFYKKRQVQISKESFKIIPIRYYLIGMYCFCRITANIYYITIHKQAFNTIFSIIIEQLFLVIAFYFLKLTKEEILDIIKITVWCATTFFLIGIFESFTFIRPFDSLYVVSSPIMNEHYVRLGLLRATTTLGMPVMYGNMCVLMLPLILYIYVITKQKRYLICVSTCILAIIHSGSRADLLFIPIVMSTYFLYVLRNARRRIEFGIHLLTIISSLLLLISILCFSNPLYNYFYLGTGKSVLNELGYNYDLDENAPENTEFDSKAIKGDSKGTTSRLNQFSGILFTCKKNPIFGLGSGAQNRGEVQYYWNEKWHTSYTFDVGYVQVFCEEGILGSIGFVFLALAIVSCFRVPINYTADRCLFLLPITYALICLSSANMFNFLILIVIITFETANAKNR